MCYECETSEGMYKNRMTPGRLVLCVLGLFFVICIGKYTITLHKKIWYVGKSVLLAHWL